MKTIKLERALPKDYQDYMALYDNMNINMIYTWRPRPTQSDSQTVDNYFDGYESPESTFDDFQKEIFSESHFLYLIKQYDPAVKKYKLIGYIHMMYIARREYRLVDWAMTDTTNKQEVWNQLLKLKFPQCRRISVYMGGTEKTIEWLQELGFEVRKCQYGMVDLTTAKQIIEEYK